MAEYDDANEGDYNKRLVSLNADEFCLMDRNLTYRGGAMEFCDVFPKSKELIHIKRVCPTNGASNLDEWIPVDPATNTYEHASWIGGEDLENLLGPDLHGSAIRSSELRSKNPKEQLRIFLSLPERFEAVVGDDQRFEYLVDRNVLLEQVAIRLSSESDRG